MASAVTAAPETAAKKISKKPAAVKKPKSSPAHPPFLLMITEAIATLKERTGSSQYAIAKFIEEKHKQLPSNFRKLLLVRLKKLVASGQLVKVKASFKIPSSSAPASNKTAEAGPKAKSVAKPKPKKTEAAVPKPKPKAGGATKPKAKAEAAAKPKAAGKRKAADEKPKAKAAKVAKTAAKSSPGKKLVKPKKAAAKKPKSVKSPARKKATTKK